MDLFDEFRQITSAFEKQEIEYALCGGLAMAVYAFPRATWETKKRLRWDEGMLPVVSPEGLIHLKSFRQSGQDQDDIKYLRKYLEKS